MQNKKLHIISFDNPFPPVYGGVIDVFYKVKALHKLGFEIYLHCFVSKIPENCVELNGITEKVFFYKSSTNPFLFVFVKPFSVISRNNKNLLKNLGKVDAPVLFEGLKTTYLMKDDKLQKHFKILRLHNIEQDYFEGISRSETSLLRKMMFRFESMKFKNYEKVINKFDKVIALSHYENDYVNEKFGNSTYIPVFHGNDSLKPLSEFGKYALYHGDLRMSDNKRAAAFLINVFKKIPDYKLIIASSCGADFIESKIASFSNISYVYIESQEHLDQLLTDAHINVMLSFQQSGTKLKLISALYKSRFCIINKNIVDDKNTRDLCEMAETEVEFIDAVNRLIQQPYLGFDKRTFVLNQILNDNTNAQLIDNLISEINE
jgi:hypothetical protein